MLYTLIEHALSTNNTTSYIRTLLWLSFNKRFEYSKTYNKNNKMLIDWVKTGQPSTPFDKYILVYKEGPEPNVFFFFLSTKIDLECVTVLATRQDT